MVHIIAHHKEDQPNGWPLIEFKLAPSKVYVLTFTWLLNNYSRD